MVDQVANPLYQVIINTNNIKCIHNNYNNNNINNNNNNSNNNNNKALYSAISVLIKCSM